jgi:Hypothetical glycosyl hydrolase family 15
MDSSHAGIRLPARVAPRRRRALALVCAAASALGAAPALAQGSAVPPNNQTANPSFEADTAGWAGLQATVRSVRDRRAPDGRRAARVKGSVNGFGIDDSPPTVPVAGESSSQYTALAWVRGSARTAKKKVELVVTELAADGSVVGETRSRARLPRKRFKKLSADYTPAGSGNQIELRVTRAGKAGRRDSFLVDAISLVPRAPVTTTSQLAITYPHEEQLVEEQGSRYRYAVMRDVQFDEAGEFQAANPGTDTMVYKNVGFTVHDPQCNDDPYQASGVSWCQADSHEEWFLHDAETGERIVSSGYSSLYAMDIGDPGYQQAWLESVLERLRDADGTGTSYDGAFLDDTNLDPVAHGFDGRIQEMSDDQYRDAMQGFIAYVGPRLQQEGFDAMPNLSFDTGDAAQRAAAVDVATHVTTVNREYFVRWGSGSPLFTGGDWKHHLTLMEEILATGAGYNGIAYGSVGDVQAQRYARATFLLGWDGEDGSSLMFRPDESSDPYLPDWTTDVGTPIGSRTPVGSGWMREFTDGVVVINPSASGSQDFSLSAAYRLPNGECAQSVVLEATEALVLPDCA